MRYPPRVRVDGPPDAPTTVVLAHGAGTPMDAPFLETVACALAARAVRVARFEFPYMTKRREEGRRVPLDRRTVLLAAWRDAIEKLGGGSRLVIGGESLGGGLASPIAGGGAGRRR